MDVALTHRVSPNSLIVRCPRNTSTCQRAEHRLDKAGSWRLSQDGHPCWASVRL